MADNPPASIEVVANLNRGMVDIKIVALDVDGEPLLDEGGEEEVQCELSVHPELSRELAFRLSLAAIKIEENSERP